jgi:hypothetical protein
LGLLPLGILAAADAAAELAYIAIPKSEELPPPGCCLLAEEDSAARFLPPVLLNDDARPWASAACYALNLLLIAGLVFAIRNGAKAWRTSTAQVPGIGRLPALLLGSVIALGVSIVFLIEIAAPALLNQPYHHCVYDLIPQMPEAVIAIGLYVAGFFLLAWAGVAASLGRTPETESFRPKIVRTLLCASLGAYSASLIMISVELLLSGAVA